MKVCVLEYESPCVRSCTFVSACILASVREFMRACVRECVIACVFVCVCA